MYSQIALKMVSENSISPLILTLEGLIKTTRRMLSQSAPEKKTSVALIR
jgi:hypothetical protein